MEAIVVPGVLADPLLSVRRLTKYFPLRTGLFGRATGQVRAVVTLGSPFSGDPKQNNVWRIYERIARHKVDDPPIPRVTKKPPVPHAGS